MECHSQSSPVPQLRWHSDLRDENAYAAKSPKISQQRIIYTKKALMYETKIPRVETHEHAAYVATQVNTGFKPGQRNMAQKEQVHNDTLDHAQKIDKNLHHWQCIYCGYISKGEGITRMKMHLADRYPYVAKCKKVPMEVYKTFQDKLQQAREDTMKKKESIYDEYESRGNDIDLDLRPGICASLEHQYTYEKAIRHR
ncbi:hypothetical protein C4D60_Mb11t16790 [Musa balbisiana]|uniref:BED-type domain-containing protein n=1 Tax=Musa balbisiana TaxID=52838 RepID=A0A4S8J4M4_MUSBA|nr:hypothetical protein C4D60_Mb11t16790 [Musa balbisiana]